MADRGTRDLLTFHVLVEDAGARGCLGHVPALPGLSFRAGTVGDLEKAAPTQIEKYAAWLETMALGDLTPTTEILLRELAAGRRADLRLVLSERVEGTPVWESGNAAALFEHDRRPLDDGEVAAHLRFTGRVLARTRAIASPLSASVRASKPAPGRRSIDETLEHIGNCVWWYCSRIDDALPEPAEPPGEDPLDRIDRLFEIAEAFLISVRFADRARIHVPARFPTKDPEERWTHTKVCRRQAEHVWTHLFGLQSSVPLDAAPRRSRAP